MKRIIGLGVGVAWVAAAAAADPKPGQPIIDPQPAGMMPAGKSYPFVNLSGLKKASAETPAMPTAPTVAAPYSTSLPMAVSVQPQAAVADAGCGACPPGQCSHTHTRREVAGKFWSWLTYKPGPAVLPTCTPEVNHPPIMAYFPCTTYPQGCLPGATNVAPGDPAKAFVGNVRRAPGPIIGSTTLPNPGTRPADEVPQDMKKDKPKEKETEKMLQRPAPNGISPISYQTPQVITVEPAAPASRWRSATQKVKSLFNTDPTAAEIERMVPREAMPAGSWATPPAPAVKPATANMPLTRGATPVDDHPAGLAPCFGTDGACHMDRGHCHSHKPLCTGHGNLDGYRFAIAVTKPCPPLMPLAVRPCFNDCGNPIAAAVPALPVATTVMPVGLKTAANR